VNRKNNQDERSINFEKISEIETLNRMKEDIKFFSAAIVKMKMVDNFDHFLPSGLRSFAKFFYSHHDFMYQNSNNHEIIYVEFLKWLGTKK